MAFIICAVRNREKAIVVLTGVIVVCLAGFFISSDLALNTSEAMAKKCYTYKKIKTVTSWSEDKNTKTYYIGSKKIAKPLVVRHSYEPAMKPAKLTLYKASLKQGITDKQKRVIANGTKVKHDITYFLEPMLSTNTPYLMSSDDFAMAKKVNQDVNTFLNKHYKVVIDQ